MSSRSTCATCVSATLLALALLTPAPAWAQTPTPAHQIAEAVQAAPSNQASGAKVLGFRADGSVTTLREGSNELVCLADDPKNQGWSVACYHESLEPFMARGRELRAQGVTDSGELATRRWAEADAGSLAMPAKPATLYVMTGDRFDAASGTVVNSFLRWVIYSPWATAEETGLPLAPTGPGGPWLMFPGTAGAHIMITPPVPGGQGR
jgi:hypothetical protein